MQAALGAPGDVDCRQWRAALSLLERGPEKRVMAILPGRFDQDAALLGAVALALGG